MATSSVNTKKKMRRGGCRWCCTSANRCCVQSNLRVRNVTVTTRSLARPVGKLPPTGTPVAGGRVAAGSCGMSADGVNYR